MFSTTFSPQLINIKKVIYLYLCRFVLKHWFFSEILAKQWKVCWLYNFYFKWYSSEVDWSRFAFYFVSTYFDTAMVWKCQKHFDKKHDWDFLLFVMFYFEKLFIICWCCLFWPACGVECTSNYEPFAFIGWLE